MCQLWLTKIIRRPSGIALMVFDNTHSISAAIENDFYKSASASRALAALEGKRGYPAVSDKGVMTMKRWMRWVAMAGLVGMLSACIVVPRPYHGGYGGGGHHHRH